MSIKKNELSDLKDSKHYIKCRYCLANGWEDCGSGPKIEYREVPILDDDLLNIFDD